MEAKTTLPARQDPASQLTPEFKAEQAIKSYCDTLKVRDAEDLEKSLRVLAIKLAFASEKYLGEDKAHEILDIAKLYVPSTKKLN